MKQKIFLLNHSVSMNILTKNHIRMLSTYLRSRSLIFR